MNEADSRQIRKRLLGLSDNNRIDNLMVFQNICTGDRGIKTVCRHGRHLSLSLHGIQEIEESMIILPMVDEVNSEDVRLNNTHSFHDRSVGKLVKIPFNDLDIMSLFFQRSGGITALKA